MKSPWSPSSPESPTATIWPLPFRPVMNAFSTAGSFEAGSSSEMLRDAIYMAISSISTNLPYDLFSAEWKPRPRQIGSNPDLQSFKVNWRQDADRIIIVFTDEEDQSFLVPTLPEEDTITALGASPDTTLYVFSGGFMQRHWRDYVNATGGETFSLSVSADQMYEDLMSILDEICLPDQDARVSLEPQYLPVSFGARYDFDLGLCY